MTKKIFFLKNTFYSNVFLNPHKGSRITLLNMKFLLFFLFVGQFFPSWIQARIPNLGPGPLTYYINPDPIRTRIRNTAYKYELLYNIRRYLFRIRRIL
jgi:hypothetical protein